MSSSSVAFVIPCYNEALTVASVVEDCRRVLPEARVYVFDNNSQDGTAEKARAAGAQVVGSTRQGKGEVIRHAFSILREDVLIILDGDGTYAVACAPEMRRLVAQDRYDMVVCTRRDPKEKSYPRFHRFGNRVFSGFVGLLLGQKVSDVFSGYRAVSREFYESIVLDSQGFEIESELTVKAFSQGFSVKEIAGAYGARPHGSYSKLKTFQDGFRILKFIFSAVREGRPLTFFSALSALCFFCSLWAGTAPIMDFVREHYVHTVPRAILAASLMVLASMFLAVGLILDGQSRSLRAQSKLMRRWLTTGRDAELPSWRKAG